MLRNNAKVFARRYEKVRFELPKILITPGTLSGLKKQRNGGTCTRFLGLSYILIFKGTSDRNTENVIAIINYVFSTKCRILLFHAVVFQSVDVII